MSGLRYAWRSIRAAPWYAATVVAVMTMGIALATVAFAVVDGVLFKPLPYPSLREMFLVRADVTSIPRLQPPPVGWRDVSAWREAAPSTALTAISIDERNRVNLAGRDYWSAGVDEHFFDVVGMRPAAGGFSDADFDLDWKPESPRFLPVIISDRLWRTLFGADPAAVGQTSVRSALDGIVAGWRIAGVLPPDFVFPLDVGAPPPDVLMPLRRALRQRDLRDLHVIARLPQLLDAAGISAQLEAASRRLAEIVPPAGHAPGERTQRLAFDQVRLVPLVEHLTGRQQSAFWIVFAAAAVLQLLACVNVAGLSAARSLDRSRDLAVRRALGAGSWTLARALVLEIAILAGCAAGASLLLARPLLAWTISLLPRSVPLLKEPSLDVRVLAACVLASALSIIVVTIWPAQVMARASRGPLLSTAGATSARAGRRSVRALVGAQVALGFVLLSAAALSLTSLAIAWRNDAGYQRDRMILLEVFVSQSSGRADSLRQLEEFHAAVSRMPDVDAVAFSSITTMFLRRGTPWTGYLPAGWSGPPDRLSSRAVSDRFFEVMGLPLVDGELPGSGQWLPEHPVAVVSQTAARILWPGERAVGRVLVGRSDRRTVLGVVSDARFAALDDDPIGEIYLPDRLGPGRFGAFFHVRTRGPARDGLRTILAELARRRFEVAQATTHGDALFASLRHRALPAWLFGSLGLAALVVMGTGVLGLLAMSAARRTREMGIRAVLGATPGRVVAMLVAEQLVAVTGGLAAGGLISAWTVRGLESQLYGVTAYDPAVWTSVAGTLVAVAVIGTVIPSVRAARVDPVRALRIE